LFYVFFKAPLNPNPQAEMDRMINELRLQYRIYVIELDVEYMSFLFVVMLFTVLLFYTLFPIMDCVLFSMLFPIVDCVLILRDKTIKRFGLCSSNYIKIIREFPVWCYAVYISSL